MSGNEIEGTSQDHLEVVASEEELALRVQARQRGQVRVRKVVEEDRVQREVARRVEHPDIRRIPPHDGDTGEVITLPDGSLSIPVFEEELVVETRLVVRERIVVAKQLVLESQHLDVPLRRERIEVEVDDPSPTDPARG